MERIAVLGMGKMGAGIAARLIETGCAVTVWNRSPEACAPLVERGAAAALTPAGAAEGAEAVISMVADDEASSRVWLAEDGAMAAMAPGAVAIECSTVSHGQALSLAAEAAGRGLAYIDSPVNGGPPVAAAGKLILLVGALAPDLAAARPLLEKFSASILNFGAVGNGTAFKLINNLLGAVHIASIAEAIALAGRIGLERETLIAAIETGPCASPHVMRMARAMVENRITDNPALSIGLREKDSRYCLGLAEDTAMTLPVGAAAYEWYRRAAPALGPEDDSALIRTVAEGMAKPG